MSSDSHMIGQVHLDLGFFSVEKNHELQERVSRLFNSEISRQMDLLFSDTIAGDEILQIKQLSLDLGEINYSDLEKELPARIIASLKEKIISFKKQAPEETGNYKLLDSKRYKLNAIEHYLLTGNLLRKGTDIHSGIESYLVDLLTEDPSLLIRLLKKTGKKERARIRIAWQFREKTIISVINALEPAYRQVLYDYTQELELTDSPVTTIQAQSEDFKRAKYFFALTYLFVEKGSVFNTRNFVRSLLKQLSAHYNMDYREFLLLMTRQIRQSPGTFSKGLEGYIREIFMEDFELSPGDADSPEDKERPDVTASQKDETGEAEECLFFFLENGSMPLHSGTMSPGHLQRLFLRLISTRPQQIKDIIGKRAESSINTINRFFSEEAVQALIGLYAPSHAEWILSLTASLLKMEIFADLFEDQRPLKSKLFRAVLSQLVSGSENNFQKAAFLEKLVSSLSPHSGLSVNEFRARLKSGFERNHEKEYRALLGATDTPKSNREPDPENDRDTDARLSPEQMTRKIAEMQPAQSQWILSLKDLLLKARSYEVLTGATHLSSATREIEQVIYNATLNYTKAIFDRRDFFNRILQSLAEKSTSDKTHFLTKAKTAIDKAGGEAYSRLIDSDTYRENPNQTSEENKSQNIKEELSTEEATRNAIQKLQAEHSTWILSLHRVITEAHSFFPFTDTLHKSTLRPELYRLLLQATESYPHRVFDKSDFFTHFLVLLSRRSPLDTHTFLKEAKKAIGQSSQTSYRDLIHPGLAAASETPNRDKKEILSSFDTTQLLTERQELDCLLYFLANGESPWWSGIKDAAGLKRFWQKHFTVKKKKRLMAFIQSHIAHEPVRKNLLFFLEDELSNNTLKLSNRKAENAWFSHAVPQIRRSLTTGNSNTFIEAYLIYSLQKKEKKKELIWEDIQNLFSARGISVRDFYQELLTLQPILTDIYFNDFFLLFHSKLSGQLNLKQTNEEPLRHENKISSPDNIRHENEKKLPSGKRREEEPEKKQVTKDPMHEFLPAPSKTPKTEQSTEQSTEKETLRYLEVLLHFLNTGVIPGTLDLHAKELILKVLSGLHKIRNHANTRLLYLSLKNELLFKRFSAPFDAKEQEKLMKIMFPDEYAFLEPYLKDFITLFSNKNLKRQIDKDLVDLRSASFLFFIEYFHKNTNVSEYIRFVAKHLFTSAAAYHSFSALTKLAILRKEMQLNTFLPSMLLTMMQQEKKKENKKEQPADDIKQDLVFIENAGLILLWPFMSFYFEKLGLLSEHKFTSVKAAIRGACLLQYLITGTETSQEHELPLNKILCQLPKNHPVYITDALTQAEKDLSEELLKTAISRWEIIKNTSIEGFRNSFLKREGKLEWPEDKIILTVEPKTFDMLVDKIPWNISVIKLPWMKQTLHVKWR